MTPTLTLHCPRLVQNIKIRISCDVCVYTWKILRSSGFSFPPPCIWAIGVSNRSQSHELQKWHPRSKRHACLLNGQSVSKCVSTKGLVALSNRHNLIPRSNTARKYWSPTKLFVTRKIFWIYLYRNCLRRYTKCVAFLELNGIKKSRPVSVRFLLGIFCYLMGHFPRSANSSRRSLETRDCTSFRCSCDGSTRNVQAVRNIDFSYFINLLRNSSTLRPLELDVQPTFCRFFSASEHEHVWSVGACLVSCFRSSQQCRQFVLYLRTDVKVHKISIFKEYNLVCLLWKSQI